MKWTKENMFEPSGCLTREAFEALVSHQLNADAKAMADEHLASCPFCSDAQEGFMAQETDFATLMDQADQGFEGVIAKAQFKSTRKRTLWISISAAASVLMLVGLFLLINQPQPKMQVAQNAQKDTIVDKVEKVNKPATEGSEKMKQKAPETKTVSAKPEKKTIKFVSPEISKSEDASATDALVMETQTNAPVTAPIAVEEKMVVAEEVTKDDRKETEAYKKGSDKSATMGMAKSRRAAESPAAMRVSADEQEPALSIVEKMPEYPGGSEAMLKFIKENLQYPQIAGEMAISGKVFLQFVVEKNGKISNIKVLRGIGGGCDEEAIRVVKLMPNWKPSMQNGKPVPVYFTLPIIFSLQK